MSLTSRDTISSKEPYPGLRFYEDDDALFFAGRESEIKECAALLVKSQVLILHGRTGCGKSSFLRAGVKPRVSTFNLGLNFSEGFVVVRSTGDPLRRLVRYVMQMTKDLLETRTSEFGDLDDFSEPSEISQQLAELGVADLGGDGFQKAVDHFSEDGAAFVEVLVAIAGNMKNAPIFVIDQGEEVFTMAGKGEEGDGDADGPSEANADIGRNIAATQFFRFLHQFARSGRLARVVVSLRTEWKGLFDDRIAENGPDQVRQHPGASLSGYYLKDLEKEGLIQAILRPTLKAEDDEWLRIVDKALPGQEIPPAPFDQYGFTIDENVVTQLADSLLGGDIPFGGVLPTMQVACLRLWRQASQASASGAQGFEITRTNFLRLGKISDQIEEFLAETVESICNSVRAFRGMVPQVTRKTLHELSTQMVEKQADGRAVTRAVPYERFLEGLSQSLPRSSAGRVGLRERENMTDADWDEVMERIATLLLDPRNNIVKEDNADGFITLGHDSLALALRNWSIRNPLKSMAMMMTRMGMGSSLPANELTQDDLFLKEDPPHKVTIVFNRDYVWDRHLPELARQYDFGRRLGIEFKHNPSLNVLSDNDPPPRWDGGSDSMVKRLKALDKEYDEVRTEGRNRRVMVVSDWDSFPGEKPEDGKDDPRKEFAGRFSDILVTNISIGNQLIGPPDEEIERARGNLNNSDRQSREDLMQELVLRSLERIKAQKGVIYCLDSSGRDLLILAARFVRDADKRKALLTYLRGKGNVVILRSEKYTASDPLIQRLLGERATRDGSRPRYIVGSSFSQAMAIQCGFVTYFGAKALAELGKYEMERRQVATYEARQAGRTVPDFADEEIGDIPGELQNVVTHTLWQLGIEPSKWRQGLNRSMVLRLASVGYYSAEYTRTHMDDFIAHIQSFVNDVTAKEAEQENDNQDARGIRLNQKAIDEALQECFAFLRFDEYGSEVYDLDGRLAYWSDHGALNTKSIAGEIYSELVSLRAKTIESFELTAQSIAWMRLSDSYNPGYARVALAFRLKELAWNHFRIFNFFDSERYMSLAAHLLQEEMECSFFRAGGKSKGGILNSALGND